MQTVQPRALGAHGDAACRAMFAARKQVFIDTLKWDLPVLANEFEVDEFDTPDAEYLIILGKDGAHRASARLLRTDQDHLLGKLYPFLCAKHVPHGPNIREITRFCLDLHQTSSDRRIARNQLVTGLAETALRTGITAYTGVADLSWFKQIAEFGWACTALGQPVRAGRQTLVALQILIDDQTLAGLRATGIYCPMPVGTTGEREARS